MEIESSGFTANDVWELGKGLLFGDDSGFSYQFQQLVKMAGVTHLVAASGANLAFVLTIPGLLLKKNSYWIWKVASFFSVWLYWQYSTQASSLWRAVVMWVVLELAHLKGYQVSFSRVALILFVALALWGREYWTSPGYWLSWHAVCGLQFSRTIMSGENRATFLPRHQKWRNRTLTNLIVGLSVWLFVAPWIWWWWQQSSWLGIWTTWLLDPWLPLYQWGASLLLVLPSSWWLYRVAFTWLGWLFSFLCQLMRLTVSVADSFVGSWFIKVLLWGLGWLWWGKLRMWWRLKKETQRWRWRFSQIV